MRDDTHHIKVVNTSFALVIVIDDHRLSFLSIADLRLAMLGAQYKNIPAPSGNVGYEGVPHCKGKGGRVDRSPFCLPQNRWDFWFVLANCAD